MNTISVGSGTAHCLYTSSSLTVDSENNPKPQVACESRQADEFVAGGGEEEKVLTYDCNGRLSTDPSDIPIKDIELENTVPKFDGPIYPFGPIIVTPPAQQR